MAINNQMNETMGFVLLLLLMLKTSVADFYPKSSLKRR